MALNRPFDDDFRPQSAPPVLTYPDHQAEQPSDSGDGNGAEDFYGTYEYYLYWQQNQHNPRLRPPTVDWRVDYEREMRGRTVDYQNPFPGPMPRSGFEYPSGMSADDVGMDPLHNHPMDRIQKAQDFPRTPSPPMDLRRMGDNSGRPPMNATSKNSRPQRKPVESQVLKALPPQRHQQQQSAPNAGMARPPVQPMGQQLPFPMPAHLASDPSTPSFSASFNQYGDLPMSPLTPQRSLSDPSMSPAFPSPMHMARPGPQSPVVPYLSPTIMSAEGVQQPQQVMPGYPNQMDHMHDQFAQTQFFDPNYGPPMDHNNMYDRHVGMGPPMRAVLGMGEPSMYANNRMMSHNPHYDSSGRYGGGGRFGMDHHPYQQYGSESSMPMEAQNGDYGSPGQMSRGGSAQQSMGRGGPPQRRGNGRSGHPGSNGSNHSSMGHGPGPGRGHGPRGGHGQSGPGNMNGNTPSHRSRGGEHSGGWRDEGYSRRGPPPRRGGGRRPPFRPRESGNTGGGNSDFDARQLIRGQVSLQQLIAEERVVNLACDQNGSRFIQTCLEKASDDEKQAVFEQIYPETLRLCADVFGNYVIQKFFEYGSERHKMDLASCLRGRVLPLSLSMYGCRVIQKALECVNEPMRVTLVQELVGHVEQCVRDQNGNHVIQKCIEEVPNENLGFICSTFVGKVFEFSTHPYGCRVIQRLLEHSTRNDELIENEHTPEHRRILQEILQHIVALSKDQYGNYVVQHVLEHGPSNARDRIVSMVLGHVLPLSKHKFASNVVEKAFMYAKREDQREALLDELIGTEDNSPLPTMVRDQYANYVIQTVLDTLVGSQRSRLIRRMNDFVPNLRKFIYGKHIVNKIEQLTGRKM